MNYDKGTKLVPLYNKKFAEKIKLLEKPANSFFLKEDIVTLNKNADDLSWGAREKYLHV